MTPFRHSCLRCGTETWVSPPALSVRDRLRIAVEEVNALRNSLDPQREAWKLDRVDKVGLLLAKRLAEASSTE